MPKETEKEIFRNDYMSLFDNGTIGLSDGVGYLYTFSQKEVIELYNAIKAYLDSYVEEYGAPYGE